MNEIPSPLERAAIRNIVKNYLRVKPGENVIVDTWAHTLRMASTVVDEVRRAGGRAFLAYEDDDAWWRAVDRGQTKLLGQLSDPYWSALEAADVYVMFWGPGDAARIETVPQPRLDETTSWFDRWYQIARSTALRGVRMDIGFVTETRVHHWGLREKTWMNEFLRGCLADPKEMVRSGRRLARALAPRTRLRITHPNGTDLEVAVGRAPARIYDGSPHPRNKAFGPFDMLANVPGGELRVALDARTAEGRIVATEPSYDLTWYPWQTYRGGSFTFSGGKLTSFHFEQGQAEFAKHYAKATTGRDRTGVLTIGLNPLAKRLPYADSIGRGSLQLSVGANAYLGGSNQSNFCAWISAAGSEISADGTPIVRAGRIL